MAPPPPPVEPGLPPPPPFETLSESTLETPEMRAEREKWEQEQIPLLDSPSEAPYALPATRYEATRGKEKVIINEREIPSFVGAGFRINQKVKLYDPVPWWAGLLPRSGLRQAFGGQLVSRARQLPTLGAPTFPSAQSWGRLMPSEQEMFRGEIRSQGFPEQDYWSQWASTLPSWGSQPRFRRMPSALGLTGG